MIELVAALALAKAPPARLLVTAKEFSLSLSRTAIKSGPAIIQLQNLGEDAHDLWLKRIGGTHTYKIKVVQPGGVGELDTKLAAGRYRLWCSLADHAALGMRTTLVVRK
jgi:uncharacterized cupredoxin-like copper-binding protein